jgi:hypothetical protein
MRLPPPPLPLVSVTELKLFSGVTLILPHSLKYLPGAGGVGRGRLLKEAARSKIYSN